MYINCWEESSVYTYEINAIFCSNLPHSDLDTPQLNLSELRNVYDLKIVFKYKSIYSYLQLVTVFLNAALSYL